MTGNHRFYTTVFAAALFAAPAVGNDENFRASGAATLEASFLSRNSDSLLADMQTEKLGRVGAKFGVRNSDFLEGRLLGEFAIYGERSLGDNLTKDVEGQVNELNLTYHFGDSSIIVGRKRTEWGTGLVSSPTNIISASASPIDPDDDFFRIVGRDTLQYNYTGTNSSIDVVALYEDEDARHLNDHSIAARFYTNLSGFDLSLVGGVERNGNYVAGANLAFTVGQALEFHADVLYDSDAVLREPLFGPGGEIHHERSSSVSGLIGGQWTSSDNVNVILEYLYFQDGLSNGEVAGLIEANVLPLLAAESGDLSLLQTHYLFGRVSKDGMLPETLDVDLEYTFFQSLENTGGLHTLRATRGLNDYASVYTEFSTNIGDDETEVGQSPASLAFRLGLEVNF